MIYSGRTVVTTKGVKVALASTRTMCGWITIHANATNGTGTGYVYVGGSTVQNNTGGPKVYIGHPIAAGSWVSFRELGGPAYIDLSTVYVDADDDGSIITYTYGRT